MIIEVKNLKRNYKLQNSEKKTLEALKGISFSVKKGEIFGLLGPNGAGKSTTIKILSTMLLPTSGEVKVLGYDCETEENKIRNKINFVFGGERSLYWRLTAKENLVYFADLYKVSRNDQKKLIPQILELVGLKDASNNRVETYSKGMKQRLQIARCLINDPEVIFFDEPSIGLDPKGADDLKQLIKLLANYGKTILLTTHYMKEAEELCDRIAIINHGQIIANGTLEELAGLISADKKEKIKWNKKDYHNNLDVTLEDIYLTLIEDGVK